MIGLDRFSVPLLRKPQYDSIMAGGWKETAYRLNDDSHLINKDQNWLRMLAYKAWGDPPRPNSAITRSKFEQIWVAGRLLRKCTIRENDGCSDASKKPHKSTKNGRLWHKVFCPFLRRYA